MFAFMKKRGLTLLVGALVIGLVAFAAAACGDDDDDDGGADQTQVQKTAVLAALTAFRVEDMHELDGDAQTASEFDAGWNGRIDRMHQAATGTDWPADLQEHADAFIAGLDAADASLEAEDLAAFKGDITEAHAHWHELDTMGYAYISGEEQDGGHGDETASPGSDHEDASEASH